MSKSINIANRLQEVLLDGDWIAKTNIQEQLGKTNLELANKKVGSHHSISELTFHINYYLGGILNVLNGGDLEIRDKYSFDMEKIKTEDEWKKLVQSFLDNARSIVEKIKHIPEDQWSDPFVKKEYGDYERNIEGLIEHSYYHFGQISLLLKLVNDKTPKKKSWWKN